MALQTSVDPETPPVFIRLEDLHRFQGDFSWDKDVLRTRKQEAHKSYREEDPETWPLIDLDHIFYVDGKRYDGSERLPQGIAAFDTLLMQSFMGSSHGTSDKIYRLRLSGLPREFHHHFIDYSFYYNEDGSKRDVFGISNGELKIWKEARKIILRKTLGPQSPRVGNQERIQGRPQERYTGHAPPRTSGAATGTKRPPFPQPTGSCATKSGPRTAHSFRGGQVRQRAPPSIVWTDQQLTNVSPTRHQYPQAITSSSTPEAPQVSSSIWDVSSDENAQLDAEESKVLEASRRQTLFLKTTRQMVFTNELMADEQEERANDEKERADREQKRADNEKERADKERKRAGKAQERAEAEKKEPIRMKNQRIGTSKGQTI